jgi:hypothetical protein
MFDFLKIKQKILSVEVFFRENEEPLYRHVVFIKRGDQIDFTTDEKSIIWQDMPTGLIKKNQAVILIITGKGVITKRVPANNTLTPLQLFQNVFPNTDAEDFYYSIQENPQDVFISMVRKTLVHNVVEQLRNKGVFVIGLYIGGQVLQDILPYTQPPKTQLLCGNYQFIIQENRLVEIQSKQCGTEKINISGEVIDSAGLIALAGVFHHISSSYSRLENQPEDIQKMLSEYKYYSKLKYISRLSLVVLFLLLLINFFLFDKYNKSSRELETKVGAFSNILVEYDSLKSEFTKKKSFLETAGLLGNTKISFYADRLAADMPQTMTLESINIFPIIESENNTEEVIAEKGIIRINGLTPNPVLLNEWVSCLSGYKWVEKVTIQNYNKEAENNLSKFEVLVQTK